MDPWVARFIGEKVVHRWGVDDLSNTEVGVAVPLNAHCGGGVQSEGRLAFGCRNTRLTGYSYRVPVTAVA
jgi:hypothetical protein